MTKPAECEEYGETTYTASFNTPAFVSQHRTRKDIEPLGHDWNPIEYFWVSDNSCVIALRTCKNDLRNMHAISEVADTEYQIVKEATEDQAGEAVYIARFSNQIFATQYKYIRIPPKGSRYIPPRTGLKPMYSTA